MPFFLAVLRIILRRLEHDREPRGLGLLVNQLPEIDGVLRPNVGPQSGIGINRVAPTARDLAESHYGFIIVVRICVEMQEGSAGRENDVLEYFQRKVVESKEWKIAALIMISSLHVVAHEA